MTNLESAAVDFIENMGVSLEADGLPRIAGRMWGLFIIEDGPCSFAELAERLQVSRGSVSTNARLLSSLGILQKVTKPGDRQDYYQLADSPYEALLSGYVQRMQRTRRNAETALAQLPKGGAGTKKRLSEMQDFYFKAAKSTEGLIAELREQAAARKDA